jgi:hypothetical protein
MGEQKIVITRTAQGKLSLDGGSLSKDEAVKLLLQAALAVQNHNPYQILPLANGRILMGGK